MIQPSALENHPAINRPCEARVLERIVPNLPVTAFLPKRIDLATVDPSEFTVKAHRLCQCVERGSLPPSPAIEFHHRVEHRKAAVLRHREPATGPDAENSAAFVDEGEVEAEDVVADE